MLAAFNIFNKNLSAHCDTEEGKELISLWDSAREVEETVPFLGRFNPNKLTGYKDELMVLEPLSDGSIFCSQIGAASDLPFTPEIIGTCVQDFEGALHEQFESVYRDVISSEQPRLVTYSYDEGAATHTFERLVLPVMRPDQSVLLVVFCKRRAQSDALLDTVLNASADPIFSLRLHECLHGTGHDATVLSVNQAAALCFFTNTRATVGRSIKALLPAIETSGLWSGIMAALADQKGGRIDCQFPTNNGLRAFKVTVAPMDGGCALIWNDITEFHDANQKLRNQAAELLQSNEVLERQAAELVGLADEMEQSRLLLNREIRRRENLEKRLKEVADTDPLTGIANRRSFVERASACLEFAHQVGETVTFIMADIDHFKTINDTYGHAAGDAALVQFSEYIATSLRIGDDFVARIGGEEFAFILPSCSISSARQMADRLREGVAQIGVSTDQGVINMTASFGVAALESEDDTVDTILARADAGLYDAKAQGRNRVVVRHMARRASDTENRAVA